MKKLLLLTAAIAVLGATTASAAGVNLSWNRCNTASTSTDKLNACDGGDAVATFQGTFKSDVAVPDFAGCSSVVDIGFATATQDFWKVDGACNGDAFGIVNPTQTTPCATGTIFGSTVSGGGFAVDYPASNRVRLRIDWATGAAVPPSIAAGSLYPAFAITVDPSLHWDTCAGCADPACLVVNSIEVFGYTQGEDYMITSQDVRQYVTWNGGGIGGAGCPAATPTNTKTWGSVKALYR